MYKQRLVHPIYPSPRISSRLATAVYNQAAGSTSMTDLLVSEATMIIADVEIDAELAFLYVNARRDTEIAVVDFPIVVVFEASLAASSPEA
jgi:hypothetical protein